MAIKRGNANSKTIVKKPAANVAVVAVKPITAKKPVVKLPTVEKPVNIPVKKRSVQEIMDGLHTSDLFFDNIETVIEAELCHMSCGVVLLNSIADSYRAVEEVLEDTLLSSLRSVLALNYITDNIYYALTQNEGNISAASISQLRDNDNIANTFAFAQLSLVVNSQNSHLINELIKVCDSHSSVEKNPNSKNNIIILTFTAKSLKEHCGQFKKFLKQTLI